MAPPPAALQALTGSGLSLAERLKGDREDAAPLHSLAEGQPAGPRPLQGLGRQLFASVAVALGSMLVGFSTAYTSPALVSMRQPGSGLAVSETQASWVGSLMPLSALAGGLAGGLFIELAGRKATILHTAAPFAVAWLLIAFAANVGMVYLGRIVSGFCVGVTSLALPVYMGETIQPEVRGMLGLISTTLGNIGILTCFVAGKFLSWWQLALLGAGLSAPFFACTYFAPETPRWYISRDMEQEAAQALRWLRGGPDADVAAELAELRALTDRRPALRWLRAGSGVGLMLGPAYRRPVAIALGLMLFQQFSGINAVIFFTVRIFQDAGSSVDEFVSTMVVGAVNLAAVVAAALLIDRLGRRLLLGLSAALMALALFKLGTFFFLRARTSVDLAGYGWVPLLSFVVFVIGFSLGFGPIPWLMMGEILPAEVRGPAASLATAVNWASTFVVTKAFLDLLAGVGAHAAFWLFGAVCACALLFVVLCVPETRGRTLEDIQRRLAPPPPQQPRTRKRTLTDTVSQWAGSVASIKPTPTGV